MQLGSFVFLKFVEGSQNQICKDLSLDIEVFPRMDDQELINSVSNLMTITSVFALNFPVRISFVLFLKEISMGICVEYPRIWNMDSKTKHSYLGSICFCVNYFPIKVSSVF